MRVGERPPLACESIDVGRFDFGRPIATQVAITEVIGENHHDIRLGGFDGVAELTDREYRSDA